jgi:hypothetical protein
VGPQEVIASGVGLAGNNIGHLHPLTDEGLTLDVIAQGLKLPGHIIFCSLEVLRKIDAAIPQPYAQVLEVLLQPPANLLFIHVFPEKWLRQG